MAALKKFSLCSLAIRPGGDPHTIVVRDRYNPVTWPEVLVLEHIHKAQNVSDIKVVGEVQRTVEEELARLQLKYNAEAIEYLFPGTRPVVENEAPVEIPRDVQTGSFAVPKSGKKGRTKREPVQGELFSNPPLEEIPDPEPYSDDDE